MDVRVEMYRIPLDCINSPDLTMHFRIGSERFQIGFDNDRTGLIMI